MLEIHVLEKDNESLVNQPVKFKLVQIKNGNYVLSNFGEHYRLKSILSDWQKKHGIIENLEKRYQKFLESNKNIQENKIESSAILNNYPLENGSNLYLDSFRKKRLKTASCHNMYSDISEKAEYYKPDPPIKKKLYEMKYPEGDRVFIGYSSGYLLEYSIDAKRIVHDFDKILNEDIISINKTSDNKSLFLCDWEGGFREFDIPTRKKVNNFEVQSAKCCVVTYDNQFLITAENKLNCLFTKWSIQTKKKLHVWNSNFNEYVWSQNCSYDDQYQFIVYGCGYLGIFDIQKNLALKNVEIFPRSITSLAFTQDNEGAYLSDEQGNIKMIKWKPNASSENDFDFSQDPIQVDNLCIYEICLAKDDKNILVGSDQLVSVFNIETKEVTKEFKFTGDVKGIKLIKDGTKVLIVEQNGYLSILDLESLEIIQIDENVTKGKVLYSIKVI